MSKESKRAKKWEELENFNPKIVGTVYEEDDDDEEELSFEEQEEQYRNDPTFLMI